MTDSPIDRLLDQVADLKATLRQSLQALKLVRLIHDHPDFVPTSNVGLDPKAYEQVKHAIMNAEDVLSPPTLDNTLAKNAPHVLGGFTKSSS